MWRIVLLIDFLFTKARKVLEEAKEDAMLHHAACNFKMIPGMQDVPLVSLERWNVLLLDDFTLGTMLACVLYMYILL